MRDLLRILRDEYGVKLNITLGAGEAQMRRELSRLDGEGVITNGNINVGRIRELYRSNFQPILRF